MLDQLYIDSCLLEEEYNTFSRITNSVNLLESSGIIINENAFTDTLKRVWAKLKEWIKTHIIDNLKKLWEKILNSKLAEKIKSLKEKKKNLPKDTVFLLDKAEHTYYLEGPKNESVLVETKRESERLKANVAARMIKKDLFFKLSEYVDIEKLVTAHKQLSDALSRSHKALANINVDTKNPWRDESFGPLNDFEAEFNKIKEIKFLKIDVDYNNISSVMSKIESSLYKEMEKYPRLTFEQLGGLLVNNYNDALVATKVMKECMNRINDQIKSLDETFTLIGKEADKLEDKEDDHNVAFRNYFRSISDRMKEIIATAKTLYQPLAAIEVLCIERTDHIRSLIDILCIIEDNA